MDKTEALQYVEKWLESHSDPDSNKYFIGGRERSARNLVEEIRLGSEIGKKYLDSIIRLAERKNFPEG